jgi:hypothetical protein
MALDHDLPKQVKTRKCHDLIDAIHPRNIFELRPEVSKAVLPL